jgi:hypothetical protein
VADAALPVHNVLETTTAAVRRVHIGVDVHLFDIAVDYVTLDYRLGQDAQGPLAGAQPHVRAVLDGVRFLKSGGRGRRPAHLYYTLRWDCTPRFAYGDRPMPDWLFELARAYHPGDTWAVTTEAPSVDGGKAE